jgi:hypothetical protein
MVLSVIWFFGFAGYIWISDTQDKTDFYIGQLSVCSDINDIANESLSYIPAAPASASAFLRWSMPSVIA